MTDTAKTESRTSWKMNSESVILQGCGLLIILCIASSSTEPLRFKAHYQEPKQEWGYVDVREPAHMFYWLYYTTNAAGFKNKPLVMWLQGGPGGSGTGFGNFEEIGPLDDDLSPRNTTWLQSVSLLFVDNPVGTGYSYVDNDKAYTTNVSGIAADMMVLLKTLFMEKMVEFQTVPFYIFSESYGGKMTAAISQALYKAVKAGDIKCNFKGLAMGDSWISPEDSTAMWGPYCYTNSLVDQTGLMEINNSTARVTQLIHAGQWLSATDAWGVAQSVVSKTTNGVNFYNILKWGGSEPGSSLLKGEYPLTQRMLGGLHEDKLSKLMNGPIRKKLQIIPEHVKWGGQSAEVFETQATDFMKPVVEIVDDLVQNTDLKVVVYSGQLDLIVETTGTEMWVYTLENAPEFKKATRTPVLHPVTMLTSGYVKTAKNFSFYWILDAGHMIPADQGDIALEMLKMVTNSG